MRDFLDFYNTLEVDWPIIGFFMLFSMGIAIFHTIIIGELWNINFKPKWLFFVLNPILIGLSANFDKKLGALVFIFLFVSVFILGILGLIIATLRDDFQNAKHENKSRIKVGKKPLPWWKKFFMTISGLTFFGFMLTLGPAYFIIIFFIVLPFVSSIFSKTNKKSFYNLQRTLPKSNIRSVAMGLAEISGTTKTIEVMFSRIKPKPCIGYFYTIESITTDSDGDDHYSMEYKEGKCNPFWISDATGQIKIMPEELEFIDFEIDEQYESASKRYTQYLLKENMEVLLIGKTYIDQNNAPIFQKENIKNVFGIAPIESVNNHNDMRPIWKSAGYFMYFWVILIALIFLTPIRLINNRIEIGKINTNLPFSKNSKPINSITDFYDAIYDSYEKRENIEENDQTREVDFITTDTDFIPEEQREISMDSLMLNNKN